VVNWFTSLSSAITFSIIAMLSFIGYAFLEALYFLSGWISGRFAAALMALFVIGILGVWIWGLLESTEGSQRGLIALLIVCVVTSLIAIYDIILYSPIPYGWPLVQIAVWLTFISSALAILAIGLQLWR
jgi:hypothetical protein